LPRKLYIGVSLKISAGVVATDGLISGWVWPPVQPFPVTRGGAQNSRPHAIIFKLEEVFLTRSKLIDTLFRDISLRNRYLTGQSFKITSITSD